MRRTSVAGWKMIQIMGACNGGFMLVGPRSERKVTTVSGGLHLSSV